MQLQGSSPTPIGRPLLIAAAIALFTNACIAWGVDGEPLRVLRHLSLPQDRLTPGHATSAAYRLRLRIAVLAASGWRAEDVLESARIAVGILGQCAIGTESIELDEIEAPSRYRTFFTPVSRQLAARLALSRPALFFLADTRQHPAFDAEAIGRANSRTRPEMADSVWIVREARDLEVVIAHELAHVLADSGEHSEEEGNLMREETAPGRTRLTPAQCARIVKTAGANGLLRPSD